MSAGTLIVILGICGSGKSELIKRLDVDIFGSTAGFDWNLNGEHERLISALKEGKSCAVIEVGCGDTARRGCSLHGRCIPWPSLGNAAADLGRCTAQ